MDMRALGRSILLMALLLARAGSLGASVESVREKILIDFDWKFALGDASSAAKDFGFGSTETFAKAGEASGPAVPDFNDSSWRSVNLPHDWAVELDFVNSPSEDMKSHGYKPVGRDYPATSIGWYRHSFSLPKEDEGKRIELKFDGVFRDCQVWLNGHYLGRNPSGYGEFVLDVSAVAEYGGKNVLAVRVDATQYEGWFYEGAGIYRHVWLLKYPPVHIPVYGTYVNTEVYFKTAVLHFKTTIRNDDTMSVRCMLASSVIDDSGKACGSVATDSIDLPRHSEKTIEQQLVMGNPKLWSLRTPSLYRWRSAVVSRSKTLDMTETEFGIRTIVFDRSKGLLLNGEPVKIQGVCCHQDHAGVGSALPDRLQYYRIEKLKEMGCNAYRTSHNPPANELLEACDRLGMLVMDENRLMGTSPELTAQFETLVLRDRNHPSVMIWSLGNEEWAIQNKPAGTRIAKVLKQIQQDLDPSRVCTFAGNNGNHYDGINSVVDVRGINYLRLGDFDKYHADHPAQPIIGSEEASTLCTRGETVNDTVKGYVRDEDVNIPGWGSTAEWWWTFAAARPWYSGGFVWTGFDYRGEPTPYGWPCINSHFGIMDVCGFPKNNYYYYQSWWTDKDVLHLSPHWNWKEAGTNVNVWCRSNCDSVELFLNGRSLGRKIMKGQSHLEWNVPYKEGRLEAKGWRKGREISTYVETTGAPAEIRMSADRTTIDADGRDVSVVTVTAVDRQGREVPLANDLVKFGLKGAGEIIGVGNGDPSSHEPDKCPAGHAQRRLFNGKCMFIVQSSPVAGAIELEATAGGLRSAKLRIASSVKKHN